MALIAVTAAIAISPAQSQTGGQTGQVVAVVRTAHSAGANLAYDDGAPAKNPHYYTAGTDYQFFSELYVVASDVTDTSDLPNSPASTGARYNSGWSKYNVTVQQWNQTGMSWGTPATGVALRSYGVSCPGTAPSCDVAQAALRTGQSHALGDFVALGSWELITPATLTAPLRIVATPYSIMSGVETAGLTHSIELRLDAGPKPKLFFFSGNTPARPCTDAEIAAEAQDACDPANIAVDDPVIIGFTVLNGNEDQSQITTNAGQRTRLRSFRDFHRIEFSSDGPGAFRSLHPYPCYAALNTCTVRSADWQGGHRGASNYGSYAVGEAETLDAAVGAAAVAFYPLASQARDYTITANLHLTQSGNAVATHQITVEDLHGRAAARLTGITVQGNSGGAGTLQLAPSFNLPAWDSATKAPATDRSTWGIGGRPILFDELGADGLTVSVDKGSFTLQGSVSQKGSDCTPTDDGCTWSRTKAQFLAEQGLQDAGDAGLRSIGIGNGLWYFRAPLDDEGPATITASLHTADGNTQVETAAIPYFRVTKPTFEVRLAGGDDAVLKPGSTAEVEIGFRFRADSSPFLNWRYPIVATESGHGEIDAPWDSRLSRIEISGPAVWDDTGGRLYSLTPTGMRWECAITVPAFRDREYFCRIGKQSHTTDLDLHESPRIRVDEGAVGAVAVSTVLRAPSASLETFGNSFFIAHQRSSSGTWSTRAFYDARYDIGPVHSASASWEVGGSGMAPDDIAVYLDADPDGQGRGYYRPDARTDVSANPDDLDSVSHTGHFISLSLQRSDVASEDRGHNCPWDSDDECERARFNDPWHRVDLRLEVRNDSTGSFSAVDSATHHIRQYWWSVGVCDDPVGDALCTITRDEWRALSRTTAGDASVPGINRMRVLLPLGEQRNHRVVADLYALRTPGDASTAYKVDSHSIPLIPERTPTVKLFFYKVEGGQTRPCTDAEMAAEAGDDCDPVISDGRPIHIGFTVLNGPGDHTATSLDARRWIQAPYNHRQLRRISFSLNGPGTLDGIEIGSCNNSAAGVGVTGGTCTIFPSEWRNRQSDGVVGAFDRAARAWSDAVGHAALAFAPLPTSDPRDFTITARAETWDQTAYVTVSTSTLSVEGALAQPGTPQVTTEDWVDLRISAVRPELRAPRKSLRSLPGTAVAEEVQADDAGIVLAGQLPASDTAIKHIIAEGRIGTSLYNGGTWVWTWCSPDPSGGCALEITRSQLFSTEFADSAPVILRALSLYPPVGTSGPARITSTVTTADGSTTPPTVHEIPHERISEPVFEVRFPDDADGILEPGQEAQVQAGWLFTIDRPQTQGFQMGTGFTVGSQYRDREDQMIYTDPGSPGSRAFLGFVPLGETYFDEAATRFILAGDAVWENGEATLPRGEASAIGEAEAFTCDAEEAQSDSSSTTFFCWHSSGPDKQLPLVSIAEGASSDVKLHANFRAARADFPFRVDYQRDPPVGTTVNSETALAWRRYGDLPRELFGSFTIPVRVVEQLSAASVARAGAAAGAIRTGRSAGIELRVRNAEAAATNIDAVSSIVVQATAGALGGAYCDGGTTCTIDLAEGSAFRTAVAADPKLMGQIPITFTAPDKSGSANVSATVVGGGSAAGTVLSSEPLEIEYTSEAVVLSLTANVPRVLAYDTPDEGADKNDDDVVEIAVSAMDDRGASTGVPPTATREIRGPDGEVVSQGIVVTLECPIASGAGTGSDCKFVLDVDAAEENPLKAGLYTFTARLSSEASAMAEFAVAGRPASVSVSAGDVPNIGRTMAVEITVADEGGQPAADGTKVRVSVVGREDVPAPLVLVNPANGETETANGRATARFVVTGNEVAVVRVSAGGTAEQPDAATVAIVDARGAAAPEDAAASAPAAGLSTSSVSEDGEMETPTDTLSFWQSSTPTTASELLADLPDAAAVWLWNGKRWIRYAERDGVALPGSIDFPLHLEDLLWIEGG